MDFNLSDEQKILKEMVHSLTENEIRPKAMEWDKNEQCYPDDLTKKYNDLGLMGITLPEEFGGQGLTVFEAVLVIEEIARVSPLAAFPIFESSVGPVMVINLFGTKEHREKYIPKVCSGEMLISVGMTEPEAGSALTDMKTTATLDGDYYVVNGTKRFVSGGGHSEAYLVYVRMSEQKGSKGIGALLIEKGMEGFTFGKQERFMGLKGLPS
ncbi:MAG: acyl-CoA dehydrogenase family protein, partial [Deferribacterota bacterium]|nr:acyl-CoA dehydrogenase family protein [Deferribacterota bacterium]